ncbi:hypothetical protein RUND412_002086 [Rhizina undulata]
MSNRRSRRPPSLNLSLSSRETSPTPTASTTPSPEPDTDGDRMSSNEYRKRQGDSMTYPTGPYCVKRPTLAEVLSNTAPPPYTLSAFMAYLSQNHCLETLEFTMDAGRYRKHFNALIPPGGAPPTPDSEGCAYVRMLWQKLLDAYIVPNGPREVNLPSGVRDHILSIPNKRTPPPPETLDPAVSVVYELMQESVLMPFLNDCQNAATYSSACPWEAAQSDESIYVRGSLDERQLRRKRDISPHAPIVFVSNSYSTSRPRAISPFSANLGWNRNSHAHPPAGSWTSTGSGESLLEDSGTSSSGCGPMTPPTTPPTSDAHHVHGSPKRRTVDRAEKSWKKMTGNFKQFGWNKRKGAAHICEEGSL